MCRALLQYRNTPSRKDGLSPPHKLYGQPVQDTLPAHHKAFSKEWQRSIEEAEHTAATNKKVAESYYYTHTHNLHEIRIGSNVVIQNPVTKP